MILKNCKYVLKMKDNLTIEDCDILTGTTGKHILENIWVNMMNANIYEMNSITKNVINNGININDLLKFLKNKIVNTNMSNQNKSKLIMEILNVNTKLLEKADEYLQLLYLFSLIIMSK
jgi:hypothetical protein